MTHARYKIVFTGELMPEVAADTVKDNLARLFKSDRSKIEALFSGAAVALKRDLTEDDADKYLAALQQAGARVHKEKDLTASLSLVETDDHRPASEPAVSNERMSCPKCGHEQAKAIECQACGIVIEKYLARQAQLAENPPPASVAVAATSNASEASPYATPKAQVAEQLPEFGELKVFSVNGRIGRVRYLAWSAAIFFAALGLYLISALAMAVSPVVGGILMAAIVIAAVVVSVQIGVQRLHDIGWSGWLLLVNLIPVVGGVFALIMLVVPGTAEANRYGPPPPPNSTGAKVLAFTWLLVPIIGILAAIAIPQYQQYTQRAAEAQMEMPSAVESQE
ncbi:DUF805 domain-containing protein [Aquipseudomonas guryensis]|jgi:uncharacterized membrane protein YhaH (DUF805 family)|uniref:DUF805 domain-containing protein n=1 Tax=Aquipseudomonas guryensis TaxID=2759165 RepID=A0A7W4DAN2_9GAMM|nr:DUF805 domain-containing protein [Pseudomonas guryensis]MBB1519095.1 DUF805 domain-containing protein [Pseudomonas guryensis]